MEFKLITASQSGVSAKCPGTKLRYTTKQMQQDYIRRWRASGLSQTKFCLSHGLNPKSLSRWIRVDQSSHNSNEKITTQQGAQGDGAGNPSVNSIELRLPNKAQVLVCGELSAELLRAAILEAASCK